MGLVGFAFSDDALDYLECVPLKLRKQILKKAKALMLDPHPSGAKQLKGIKTAAGEVLYRQRSGDYRILYVVREQPAEVIVLDIDHRKDVYK